MEQQRHELLALLVKSRRRLLRCQEIYRDFESMLEHFGRLLNDKSQQRAAAVSADRARQA